MATKTGSVTVYPAEFISNDYQYQSIVSGYAATNPIGKSSTNSSGMARFNLKTGSSAVSYVYYRFDLSSIPENATITSISCSVKPYINQTNSSRIQTRQVQMFYGTTQKGSATTFATSQVNLTCGSWTREELNDCRIRLYVARGTSNTTTTYYMGLYGATLTVNYSYDDTPIVTDKFYIKDNNSWVEIQKVYKKENGVWVEQTEYDGLFDTLQNYIKAT